MLAKGYNVRRLAWLIVGLIALLGGTVRLAGAEQAVDVVAELPGGKAASGLAFGPDGSFYVSSASGQDVGIIFVYGPSGALTDRIEVVSDDSEVVALRGLAFDR